MKGFSDDGKSERIGVIPMGGTRVRFFGIRFSAKLVFGIYVRIISRQLLNNSVDLSSRKVFKEHKILFRYNGQSEMTDSIFIAMGGRVPL